MQANQTYKGIIFTAVSAVIFGFTPCSGKDFLRRRGEWDHDDIPALFPVPARTVPDPEDKGIPLRVETGVENACVRMRRVRGFCNYGDALYVLFIHTCGNGDYAPFRVSCAGDCGAARPDFKEGITVKKGAGSALRSRRHPVVSGKCFCGLGAAAQESFWHFCPACSTVFI